MKIFFSGFFVSFMMVVSMSAQAIEKRSTEKDFSTARAVDVQKYCRAENLFRGQVVGIYLDPFEVSVIGWDYPGPGARLKALGKERIIEASRTRLTECEWTQYEIRSRIRYEVVLDGEKFQSDFLCTETGNIQEYERSAVCPN